MESFTLMLTYQEQKGIVTNINLEQHTNTKSRLFFMH